MNPTKQQIAYLSRELLHPSETNPRKTFPQAALEELGRSIETHGVIQPLIVRASKAWSEKMAGVTHYEIVAGERRYRSGSAVGLGEFPAIVRELLDWEVVELQLIENLQREDVSAYEEAEGYAGLLELVDEGGAKLYTPDRIAEKIGKTAAYVRNRLKLRKAPAALLAAMAEGLVGTRVGELVGRIPHKEDRERCAAEVLKPKRSDNPMTARETATHIEQNYMKALSKAVFDRKAGDLVKGAGPCGTCPYRSGLDPDIEGLLAEGLKGEGRGKKSGIDPNLCLNPNCFRAKTEAHYELLEAKGEVKMIPAKEAKKLFPYGYDSLQYNSPYKLATEKPGYDDVRHYDSKKVKTWGAYAASLGVKVAVVRSPHTGAMIEVVERSAVKTAEGLQAKKEGRPSIFEKQRATSSAADPAERKREAERQKRDKEIADESLRLALDAVSGAMMGSFSREVALLSLGALADMAEIDVMLRWMGLKAQSKPGQPIVRRDKVDALVKEASDAERYDLEGVMILMVVASITCGLSWYGLKDARVVELAGLLGVDLKACKDSATATVKEAWAAKAKKAAQGGKGKAGKAKGGKAEKKKPTLQEDVDAVIAHFSEKGGKMTRAAIAKAMDWGDERTIAAYEEIAAREKESPAEGDESRVAGHEEEGEKKPRKRGAKPSDAGETPAAAVKFVASLEDDLREVVAYFGKVAGTASIDAVKIQRELGWEAARAAGAVDALRQRKMLAMGVLNRESVPVQQILACAKNEAEEAASAAAKVAGSGTSKLQAAAEPGK